MPEYGILWYRVGARVRSNVARSGAGELSREMGERGEGRLRPIEVPRRRSLLQGEVLVVRYTRSGAPLALCAC